MGQPGYGVHAVLLVRSSLAPESIVPVVRAAIRAVDPTQPIYDVEAIDQVLSDSVARQRMTAMLLGLFALVTLVLAAIGAFGVLSYSVAQRTREIGLRMAIGADRSQILLLIVRQASVFTAMGVMAGLSIGILTGHLVNGLLFHISVSDPVSLSISIAALAMVTLAAVSIPAIRAASVNPVEALRSE